MSGEPAPPLHEVLLALAVSFAALLGALVLVGAVVTRFWPAAAARWSPRVAFAGIGLGALLMLGGQRSGTTALMAYGEEAAFVLLALGAAAVAVWGFGRWRASRRA